MSLAKIIPASELRKAQSEDASAAGTAGSPKEDHEKRDAEFQKRFSAACDKYRELLLDEVAKALESAKRFSKTHAIINSKSLNEPCNGFAYTTVLYGFWNKTTKKFEDTVFTKNDIKKPFDLVKKELEELGYKLEDITDRSRSNKLFLKLSW
jgi:hypothetical protein